MDRVFDRRLGGGGAWGEGGPVSDVAKVWCRASAGADGRVDAVGRSDGYRGENGAG